MVGWSSQSDRLFDMAITPGAVEPQFYHSPQNSQAPRQFNRSLGNHRITFPFHKVP
jgi:hypothetical protein